MGIGYSLGHKTDQEGDIKVLGEDESQIITYSKSLTVILSRICRNNCPYCAFHKRDNLIVPYSTIRSAKSARTMGTREAFFAAGERPDKFPHVRETLSLWGFDSYIDYVYTVGELSFLEGLIPVIEIGFLSPVEMKKLYEICALVKIMLDSVDSHLYPTIYPESPGKKLELRQKSLQWAGKLQFPTITGILVGIGESKACRKESLEFIAAIHKEYGTIHEVLIQNFVPEPGTPFEHRDPPSRKTMLETVEMALEIMPSDVSVTIPVDLNPDFEDFIRTGIRDLGRIPVSEGPHLFSKPTVFLEEELRQQIEKCGFQLQQRFPLKRNFIKNGMYSKKLGQVFDAYRYKIKKEGQEKVKMTRR